MVMQRFLLKVRQLDTLSKRFGAERIDVSGKLKGLVDTYAPLAVEGDEELDHARERLFDSVEMFTGLHLHE